MPLKPNDQFGYVPAEQFDPFKINVPDPSTGDLAEAAMRLENDVYNMYELGRRKDYVDDPNFRLSDALAANPWIVEKGYQDSFTEARSTSMFEDISQRIRQEEADRATLASGGIEGLAWLVASGVISPVSFIPLIGPLARGWKAVGQGAMTGFAAAALQESILGTQQETRTLSETTWSLATTTALGGILGGVVGRMRGNALAQREFLATAGKLERDLTDLPKANLAILAPVGSLERRSLGAAETTEFEVPKGIVGVGGTDVKGPLAWFEKASPVGRLYSSTIDMARMLVGQITDAGMEVRPTNAGRAIAPEGLIANLISRYRAPMMQALQELDNARRLYVFEGNAPKRFAGAQESFKRMTGGAKMTRQEFHAQVSKAMYQGDKFAGVPEAKAAADKINALVFTPMLEEAKKIGLLPEQIATLGDPSYLNRLYNKGAIRKDTGKFLRILQAHFEKKLLDDLKEGQAKLLEREARENEVIAILEMPDAEIEAAFQQLTDELSAIKAAPEQAVRHEIDDLRDAARAAQRGSAGKGPDTKAYKELLEKAHKLEEDAGEPYQAIRTQERTVRRKLKALSETRARLDEKRAQKLSRIDTLESAQVASMETVIRAYDKLLDGLDKFSDEALDQHIATLSARLKRHQERFMHYDNKIWKELRKDDGDMERVLGWSLPQERHLEQIDPLIDRLDDLRGMDRLEIEAELRESYTEVFQKMQALNNRRAVRIQKLWDDAEKLDPERVTQRISDMKLSQMRHREEVEAKFGQKGLEDVNIMEATANITDAAKGLAQEIYQKIMGTHVRVPGLEILSGERGPELARLLDIATEEFGEFVETDVEKMIRAYVRTMAPDLEMFRRFGSVNMADYLGTGDKPGKLLQEMTDRLAEAPNAAQKAELVKAAQANLKAAVGKDAKDIAKGELDLAKAAMTSEEITAAYTAAHRDLTAIVSRMRHTYGVPNDPEAIGYRLGRQALNLNTLRFMGMVVVSSIPDIARFTMKFGLSRTFKQGLVPLFTQFKDLKMSAREAQLAGTALDVWLHTRMFEMMDVVDEFAVTSKLERGMDALTSKIGIIGGFDYWNTGLKGFAGVLSNAQILDSIQQMMTKGGAKSASKARDYLTTLNIDGGTAETIWQLVTNGGGGLKGNVWLPNTEDWAATAAKLGMSPDMAEKARRVFHAAVVREVDSTIVTPGVERPLSFDKSIAHKLLFQFKSFGMSSTYMTLAAGLQQKNANFALGTLQALGFGGLSYYLWALASGEDISDKGMDTVLDEAIDRSGMLAVMGFGRDVLATVPWANDYVMFAGEQTTRRGGTGMANALLGPTGDLLFTGSRVASDLDEPTQSTLHSMRKLAPLQNVWYIRQMFDALEEVAADTFDVPEKRKRQ